MIIVDTALAARLQAGNPVRVAMAGAGYMARGIALQIITAMPGIRLVAISTRDAAEVAVTLPLHQSHGQPFAIGRNAQGYEQCDALPLGDAPQFSRGRTGARVDAKGPQIDCGLAGRRIGKAEHHPPVWKPERERLHALGIRNGPLVPVEVAALQVHHDPARSVGGLAGVR